MIYLVKCVQAMAMCRILLGESQLPMAKKVKPIIQLTVLAVDTIEAWLTLADVTDECVTPVGFTDFTYSSVVAWVWVARSCGGTE